MKQKITILFSFLFSQAKQPLEIYIKPTEGAKDGFVHQYVRAFKKSQTNLPL